MSSPSTVARTALQTLLNAEFAADNIVVRSDRLDASLGQEGTVVGVSPVREYADGANRLHLLVEMRVQFYGRWDADGDPGRVIDPAKVEAYADRLRRAVGAGHPAVSADLWWFDLIEVTYPADPTGNITRFEATVLAHAQNPDP